MRSEPMRPSRSPGGPPSSDGETSATPGALLRRASGPARTRSSSRMGSASGSTALRTRMEERDLRPGDGSELQARHRFAASKPTISAASGRSSTSAAAMELCFTRYWRNTRGWTACLFDQPHVVEGVDLGVRGSVVAGQLLRVGARGRRRLPPEMDHPRLGRRGIRRRSCATCAANGGTLLVVERIVGPPNEGPETKLGDLNMLVGPGGQERTLDEFRSLFEAAGYELAGDDAHRERHAS